MSFEVVGKLHKVYETEAKTESFRAREFVIEVEDGQYPQFVKFQLVQDRVTAIDPFQEGNTVKVHFDLRGREWQDKFFTNLNAWRIEAMDTAAPAAAPAAAAKSGGGDFPTAKDAPAVEADDDLPF
ncbi:MAG: DUF3127 domain-containing protein [Saprospiraceae bacterium]